MDIVSYIQKEFNFSNKSIKNTLSLLDEDCSIPFIARYRKEMTEGLNESQIEDITKLKKEFEEIDKRKKYVLQAIEMQNLLTDELKDNINKSFNLKQIEDYYLPYKKKRKTKASIAREKGLEPLAEIIMKQDLKNDSQEIILQYINKEVTNKEEALQGARDIIAEWINENEKVRNDLRKLYDKTAFIESKVIPAKKEEAFKYETYFDFSESLKKIPAHRLLAVIRGENESFLRLKIEVEKEEMQMIISRRIIKENRENWKVDQIKEAIKDSITRLLSPALSNEVLQEAKNKADRSSIKVFSANLEQLLLAPPLGEKRILAIDPGFKSGCKVVCLDEKGDLLHNDTIYPHAPQNDKKEAIRKLKSLVNAYKIEAISIGDGTASRETEHLIQNIAFDRKLSVFVVSEAGASVYSASSLARKEFPSYDVTVRGAISIGRRLSDPLAELVKIEPKSIGVGQYQHDVDQKLLKESLDNTVLFCVNRVGVNLNTASQSILSYVSGIGIKMAEKIIDYRSIHGVFSNRAALKKVPGLGEKIYQQACAFLRITNGDHPLDNSAIHPESYKVVEKMAKDLKVTMKELVGNIEWIQKIDIHKYVDDKMGLPTLEDIIKELEKPGYDPRKQVKVFSFNPSLKSIDDLKIGMIVPGIVNNITNFGCFVNIGIKENGLIHISKLTKEFISDVNSVIHIQQHVYPKVIDIDKEKKRINLSLID